jgi:stearoyl-CoA desaturase (delta-9 desaturase)
MFVWGFVLSTVFLYHVTYCINSLAHVIGSRRYETTDQSRNNFILALFAFGEGWHNNHHYYPASARNGFYWWEVDVTYYMIWTFEKLGLVWNVKPVPQRVLDLGRNKKGTDTTESVEVSQHQAA